MRGVTVNAAALRLQLARRGWSQRDLCRAAGITENTAIRMLRGLPVQSLSYYRVMTALRKTPPLDDEDAALPVLVAL